MNKFIVCRNTNEIAERGAERFAELAMDAIEKNGVFTVALSGGSTPRGMYNILPERLCRSKVDIMKIHLFWGDERAVTPDNIKSNFNMANETLIKGLSIPESNIHRIKGEKGEKAAYSYEKEIKAFFRLKDSKPPQFDLILLGMGEDGHTASLFPDSEVIREEKRLVAPVFVRQLNYLRITLTPPVINSAKAIIFLAAGKAKAKAFHNVIYGEYNPQYFPAQIVRSAKANEVFWIIDEDCNDTSYL